MNLNVLVCGTQEAHVALYLYICISVCYCLAARGRDVEIYYCTALLISEAGTYVLLLLLFLLLSFQLVLSFPPLFKPFELDDIKIRVQSDNNLTGCH